MFRQCAWCGRFLGETPPLDDFAVTHGLCPQCHVGLATQASQERVEFEASRERQRPEDAAHPPVADAPGSPRTREIP